VAEKIRQYTAIAVNILLVLAVLALALNQVSAFLDRQWASDATAARNEKLQAAQEACLKEDIPHSLVVKGVTYCYAIFDGSEYVAPLDEIRKQNSDTNDG